MAGTANFSVEGPTAGGGASVANPIIIGGVDGSGNVQPLSLGTNGGLGASNAAVSLRAATTITAPGTVNHTPVTGLGAYKQILIVLNVTAAATAVDDTMDVYVDTSADAGVSWLNVVHFPQILGNGGAKKFTATLDPAGAAGTACIAVTSDAAVNTVRPSIFGDRLRVRTVNVDGATPDVESFAFSVLAYAKG